MNAHARLAAYAQVLDIGRRLVEDPAVRAALHAERRAHVSKRLAWRAAIRAGAPADGPMPQEVYGAHDAHAAAARALSVAAVPHMPPDTCAWPAGDVGRYALVLWSIADAPELGWDLHLRALDRGDVVPVPALSGSGECVGI